MCVVCDVTISCHIHVSKPTFWRSLLTHYAYSSTRTLLIVCHCTEYKLSVLQGSKTHSSLRQSNLQLQNQAAWMSRQIRAVEHRCAAGVFGAHPGLEDRILLNHTRIENAHEVRKKTFVFLFLVVYRSPGFHFSLLEHYQIPECSYVNKCCYWARATVLAYCRNW